MTRLFDDPAEFMDDMLAGFLDAYSPYVVGVPGGVVRATETRTGKVAVVVGGGAGHYPAFCGVVGAGFADGAVVGNVFTSPSADDAISVGRAAQSGAGLLFSTGNYAGDVMNFTQAQRRLVAEGIDTRVVFVTDDIASAPPSDIDKRRGIAGDFVVFKIAGAAAEAGYTLDGVERVARLANANTRTLGVAFTGCTMPGALSPLFEVDPGTMGVGLGIHGEPGISDDEMPSAAELARLLVDSVVAELPSVPGQRVGAIVNGLGATKYEELFVLWRSVSALLASRGFEVVDPEVGELVTSLDMAGCSLTLVALDDELEQLWRAPANSPAYKKGDLASHHVGEGARRAKESSPSPDADDESVPSTSASRRCAHTVVRMLGAMAHAIEDAEEELGRIDAVAGDGDHGRGMVKGVSAALDAARNVVERGAGARSTLQAAGRAWAAKAGGTSGVLWGAALTAVGDELGDSADGSEGPEVVVAAVRSGYAAIRELGKAALGDKTMLDALEPFASALEDAVAEGDDLGAAWLRASEAATSAANDTAALVPKVGRARPLAERSVGTPDAGAVSLALALTAAGRALEEGRVS